jgi:hypothetical protein
MKRIDLVGYQESELKFRTRWYSVFAQSLHHAVQICHQLNMRGTDTESIALPMQDTVLAHNI